MTAPTKMALVPVEATEAMWSGLARDIVMWRDMGQPTGANLYRHLSRLGRDVPAWLPEIIRDIDHVPSKGDVAVAIYRAAIAAAPSSGRLTAADLERAAEARWIRVREMDAARLGCPSDFSPWSTLSAAIRKELVEEMRAAFAAIGLPVEGEQG